MIKKWAVGLMFFCTLITSTAQIFLKKGAERLPEFFTNYPLIIGCVLYGFGAVIFITALKGGDVSVLFPIIATSYIWVNILSMYYLNDSMNVFKWSGALIIFIGVSVIGLGTRKLNLEVLNRGN